jgi:hypothetical protein
MEERPKADIYLYVEEEDQTLRVTPSPFLLKGRRTLHVLNLAGEDVSLDLSSSFDPSTIDVAHGQPASAEYQGPAGVAIVRYGGSGKVSKKPLKGSSGPKVIIDI